MGDLIKKKKKSAKRMPTKKPKISFEAAFIERLGQTPREFIAAKLNAGSDVRSTQYLYEITAAAIAQKNGCRAENFNKYWPMARGAKNVPSVKKYNKLVRDRIPEIIEASGKSCTVEVLDKDSYIEMLDAKLQEELNEYQESKSLEELADLLEVMGAVVKARGYTWEQLTAIRKDKREKRGGFEKRLLLKEVRE